MTTTVQQGKRWRCVRRRRASSSSSWIAFCSCILLVSPSRRFQAVYIRLARVENAGRSCLLFAGDNQVSILADTYTYRYIGAKRPRSEQVGVSWQQRRYAAQGRTVGHRTGCRDSSLRSSGIRPDPFATERRSREQTRSGRR